MNSNHCSYQYPIINPTIHETISSNKYHIKLKRPRLHSTIRHEFKPLLASMSNHPRYFHKKKIDQIKLHVQSKAFGIEGSLYMLVYNRIKKMDFLLLIHRVPNTTMSDQLMPLSEVQVLHLCWDLLLSFL